MQHGNRRMLIFRDGGSRWTRRGAPWRLRFERHHKHRDGFDLGNAWKINSVENVVMHLKTTRLSGRACTIASGGDARRTKRRRNRDWNPNFFSIESCTKLWYHLLANNAKTRSNTRHDFYVENPCGKKPQAPTDDLHYERELQRREYNEPSRPSVRLTRCIYMVD
jgi:hypothetical protein